MVRVIIFLVAIGLAAFGAAWIADQQGTLTLTLDRWQIETSLPVFVLIVFVSVILLMLAWSLLRFLWRLPARTVAARRRRRDARGRAAITRGLIAIGTGDALDAKRQAEAARRLAKDDPLALMLRAQAAQLAGDSAEAREVFHAMATRSDTRLFGLRGLFVEAQRSDDPLGAVAVAEEALKLAPSSGWASQAVLGFRCAQNDWAGALAILDGNKASGLLGHSDWQRQRAVLLTAQALEVETSDRDRAQAAITEAVRLAPTLIPAAALSAKFLSEAGQTRKAMRILEAAWTAQPHPDLADAYMHVRLGDSALERLGRAERLAARTPTDIEGALAVARAAIGAAEYGRGRAALAPFLSAPTQRVAMLMAELARAEGDEFRAREWTQRALRSALDPVWTADGYVSDRWRPVSPVTGRLGAFQWMVPVAALPGPAPSSAAEPPAVESASIPEVAPQSLPAPEPAAVEPAPAAEPAVSSTGHEQAPAAIAPERPKPANLPPPVFRSRSDLSAMKSTAVVPPVTATVHLPDDPGVDDELDANAGEASGQPGGWRGFLSRASR